MPIRPLAADHSATIVVTEMLAPVVFPSISKDYEKGDIPAVRSHLRYIITVMAAIFFFLCYIDVCISASRTVSGSN